MAKTKAKAKQKTTKSPQVVKAKVVKTGISVAQFDGLRKWNMWMGIVLALEAIAIVVIGTDRSYPITTQYLAIDTLASDATGGQSIGVATRQLLDMPLAWVVGGFLALFAVGNLVSAFWARNWYEKRLASGLNDMRWLTFAAGGGVLLAAVGLLSGVYQVAMLLVLVTFMVAGCLGVLAGAVIRQHAGDQETRLSHLVCGVGTACLVAPIAMLALIAGGAALYDGFVPGFVWGIYGVTLFFFLAIGALTHFRIVRKGRWADAYNVERAFLLLSFLGASIVAWQIFAGALQP